MKLSMKPRLPFLVAYLLTVGLLLWSAISSNMEFLFYGITVLLLTILLHYGDRRFKAKGMDFENWVLWGFDLWIVLHILGGLLQVGDGVLYSYMLVDIVGEPYSILKYDQVVHAYCYFIAALLMWHVVASINREGPFMPMAAVTVLAASGVGGINEIIEFLATVFIPDTNVGGYENTAIDIVSNLLGACLAVPFFKVWTRVQPLHSPPLNS